MPPVERDGARLTFRDGGAEMTVTVVSPRIVRVALGSGERDGAPSYVVDREWPPAPFDLAPGEPTRVITGALRVEVASSPLRLTFLDPRGEWFLREPADGGMSGEAADAGGRRRVRAALAFSGEQHFYGLGQGGGGLDRLGVTRQLWNTQLGHGPGSDLGIPLLISNRGYGILWDNPADAVVAVGRSDNGVRIVYTAETGPLVWYLLMGGDMRGVLREAAELLGRAVLPPRWALGFLQSTRHFHDTAELRALPRTIRERRIPCDALIYLSSYGDALGWNHGVGHLEFQPALFPDPSALLKEARDQHFEIVTHEYPVLHSDSPLFAEAAARGYLLDAGYERAAAAGANYRQGQRYIDFSNPAAAAWWWAAHRELVRAGVAGWWLDGGEGPPAAATLHGGEGRLLHNVYDRLRHEAFAAGEAADRPEQRVFLLSRSGAAGMQRFGAATWTGDVNNDFGTLEAQIPLGLNTGMSGVPYWSSDVGGFFHAVPETAELYARWFQLGAFTPIFRSHGWVWREHVPWAHGPRVEAICREFAELRYRLLPYTYSLAWQAHTQGLPLMRPLVLNYPDDPRVWQLGHQFLWGDDLLVAPVTREGATTWPLYLPAGVWYDFWSGARHEGPGGITVDAPLERLPLLARAGAILPLGPLVQHTGERPLDEITLRIFPPAQTGASSHFELYEDDGRSLGYRQGRYALTSYECATGPDGVTVRIGEPAGDRAVVPAPRRYRLEIWGGAAPGAVTVDSIGALPRRAGPDAEGPDWRVDARSVTTVRLPDRPGPMVVSLRT